MHTCDKAIDDKHREIEHFFLFFFTPFNTLIHFVFEISIFVWVKFKCQNGEYIFGVLVLRVFTHDRLSVQPDVQIKITNGKTLSDK